MPWKTSIKAHWGAIAAADFFSVEVLTRGGLVRYLVLFVIDLETRRVHLAGVTCRADSAWMAQIARNLTDAAAGPLTGFGHLIVDRDPLYTGYFRTILDAAGVALVRLPANSPNLNPYAERFVLSITHECLRHIIPLGERHLRSIIREFIEHYHCERNHQGLDNVIPFHRAIRLPRVALSGAARGLVASSIFTSERLHEFARIEYRDRKGAPAPSRPFFSSRRRPGAPWRNP
jgi:hypothetical protein